MNSHLSQSKTTKPSQVAEDLIKDSLTSDPYLEEEIPVSPSTVSRTVNGATGGMGELFLQPPSSYLDMNSLSSQAPSKNTSSKVQQVPLPSNSPQQMLLKQLFFARDLQCC